MRTYIKHKDIITVKEFEINENYSMDSFRPIFRKNARTRVSYQDSNPFYKLKYYLHNEYTKHSRKSIVSKKIDLLDTKSPIADATGEYQVKATVYDSNNVKKLVDNSPVLYIVIFSGIVAAVFIAWMYRKRKNRMAISQAEPSSH